MSCHLGDTSREYLIRQRNAPSEIYKRSVYTTFYPVNICKYINSSENTIRRQKPVPVGSFLLQDVCRYIFVTVQGCFDTRRIVLQNYYNKTNGISILHQLSVCVPVEVTRATVTATEAVTLRVYIGLRSGFTTYHRQCSCDYY